MILTLKQKIKAYTSALSSIKKKNYFICLTLAYWCSDNKGEYLIDEELLECFPELKRYKRKPLKYSGGWFTDDEKGQKRRIKVLETIIANLKENKKQ